MTTTAKTREADPLSEYKAKRRFGETPEPKGRRGARSGHRFTIQKHAATRLHYDFRLELDGVLKSWAVTRGPSLDPAEKRLAVRTEDHPVDYATFEGVIPKGNYGAGTVLLWDQGTWTPVGDPHEGLNKGKLEFELSGERLHGRWVLVRFRGKEKSKRENWLLIKADDAEADRALDVTQDHTTSISSGRAMEEIADAGKPVRPRRRTRQARHALPGFREPALATLVDDIPESGDWLFEIKFDGYRALAAASGDSVTVYTRSGLDWTGKFRPVAQALAELDLDGVLLDGEIVAVDREGHSDFSSLQRALKGDSGDLAYFVFDLLEEGGKDLGKTPLRDRKRRLKALLAAAGTDGPVFFTDHIEGAGEAMLERLCGAGYEGMIAKRPGKPYRAGRSRDWLKIKCKRDQEFVIVGWRPSEKPGRPFASLLLAVHDDGDLRYAGRVGTGFSDEELSVLGRKLQQRERKTPAAKGMPKAVIREARFARPDLVAQIGFAEFTRDGLVRQARFLGLREDKPAGEVRRERAAPTKGVTKTRR